MAQGSVKGSANTVRSTCLLSGITATNGQPALATDGVNMYPTARQGDAADGICFGGRASREATIYVKGVATGGTASVTARLWGYSAALGEWVPVGTGGDTTKGLLNAGAAMGATKTNKVLHAEPLLLAGHFDRLYLEVTAISGTTMTVEAWVATSRSVAF